MKTLRSGIPKFWFPKLELGCSLVLEQEREHRERHTYTDVHRHTNTDTHTHTHSKCFEKYP